VIPGMKEAGKLLVVSHLSGISGSLDGMCPEEDAGVEGCWQKEGQGLVAVGYEVKDATCPEEEAEADA